MQNRQRLGKPRQSFLNEVVFGSLGASRSQVLVGPEFGVDNSVLRIKEDKVLVVTTDPLSYIPFLGPEMSAWLSVHLLASDLTTSGLPPEYGLFDFNLPPHMGERVFARYWKSFAREWKKLGLSIVGGHTGRYPGTDYTIIGGGFLMATGSPQKYVVSSMAKNGDEIILTKGAAIETTAILARAFPTRTRRAIGSTLFDEAWHYLPKVTTVQDALTASSVGLHGLGVTAMHDATEGGVLAGMIELATASNLGLVLDTDEIPVSEETREICKLFRIDPMISLSEGSLIISSRPRKSEAILSALRSRRIPAKVVGRLTSTFRGCRETTAKGTRKLSYPQTDPYWYAYAGALRKHWS